MFRDDICTIKRPNRTKVKGETIWGEPLLIAENIPCHLSVKSISQTVQSQSTATILYDYTLFIDTSLGVVINANDIIEVTTHHGQVRKLRAGESHIYGLTTQTHCEVDKVV